MASHLSGMGCTFPPLTKPVALAPYQVSTAEFRAWCAEGACQVSYQRAARMVSQAPLAASVSAAAIHTRVQQQGGRVTFEPQQAEGRRLLLDEPTLRSVAEITGGQYCQAQDAEQLLEVFLHPTGQISLQAERLEISAAFVGLGAISLLLAARLSQRWNWIP